MAFSLDIQRRCGFSVDVQRAVSQPSVMKSVFKDGMGGSDNDVIVTRNEGSVIGILGAAVSTNRCEPLKECVVW